MSDPHTLGRDLKVACLQGSMMLKDPGTTKTVNIDKNFGVLPLTIAAAGETRVLPTASVHLVGVRVLVVANEITNSGYATVSGQVLNTEGQWVQFTCVKYNSAYAWVSSGGGFETMLEVNRATDVSGRSIAAGSSKTLTVNEHEGKTILLDTAAGSTVTLPTGGTLGARYRFLVKTKATSNQHKIIFGDTSDSRVVGSLAVWDVDAATSVSYFAAGASDDTISLNGTTTGGQVGDWIDIECIDAGSTYYYAVSGQLVCPAGSNPATPFANS